MNTLYEWRRLFRRTNLLVVIFLLSIHHYADAQYQLVIDLDPAAQEPTTSPKEFNFHKSDGTRAFFVANNNELWTSDGTTAGTKLIKRLVYINNLEVINGMAFFSAQTENEGLELWSSNGTPGGTKLLKDIYPGRGSSNPLDLTNVNGTLYFTANNRNNGRELWKSNGTAAGTQMVKDIVPGSGWSHPERLAALGNKLFFNARTEATGLEMWMSDGTSAGTVLVEDMNPGPMSSYPWDLTASNGWLFFTAQSPYIGRQLWKTRGPGTSTVIRVINGGNDNKLSKLIDVSGTLFFQADDGVHGTELWKSDGTLGGTRMVKDLTPGPGSNAGYAQEHLEDFASVNGKLFFRAAGPDESLNIWMSDGTEEGTRQLTFYPYDGGIFAANPSFHEINGAAYFVGITYSDLEVHFCKIDMSGNISIIRRNFAPVFLQGLDIERVGANHYFFADGYYWRTDGTPSGTTKIRTLEFPAGSYPYNLRDAGESMYFLTSGPNALWKTSGTAATTTKVLDNPNIQYMGGNNELLFIHGRLKGTTYPTLWRSDGTEEGTIQLWNEPMSIQYFMPMNEHWVFFAASVNNQPEELWASDGSVAGTYAIRIGTSYGYTHSPRQLKPVRGPLGDRLFFTLSSSDEGRELWMTDGTWAGTDLVKDIFPGTQSSGIQYVTSFKNKLFFHADDGTHGFELWQSDGSHSGTFMVKDLRPEESEGGRDIGAMVATDDWLFFTATNASGKAALWKSDGTGPGTSEIHTFEQSEFPTLLASTPTHAFFMVPYGPPSYNQPFELWRTDGTRTIRLATFRDQSLHNLEGVAVKGEVVYFITRHQESEAKFLWRTDGTYGGTYEIPFRGIPERLETSGNYVYLSAKAQDEGAELFIIEESVSAASQSTPAAQVVSAEEELVTSYPNPFRQTLNVRVIGRDRERFDMEVFTSDGRPVQSAGSLDCNHDHAVGAGWTPGVYLIKVSKGNSVTTRKVIKVGN